MNRIHENWDDREKKIYEEAYLFAEMAHRGVKRKGSNIPYITHPIEVAHIVMEMTDDVNVAAAALLHDVAEDTPYTIDDINEKFGADISRIVAEETEDKMRNMPAEDTWRMRKENFLHHLSTASVSAKIVAIADKLSNIRAIKKDYEKHGESVWEKFHQKDKSEHAWYYREFLNKTRDFAGTPQWREINELWQQIFEAK